mmetsp:Transcript_36522/g.71825  ORF Transcript_36522/g.71825 Transcript_36522/m.71825 type:complete len:104 (-) Transcript_36522:74-385(-)
MSRCGARRNRKKVEPVAGVRESWRKETHTLIKRSRDPATDGESGSRPAKERRGVERRSGCPKKTEKEANTFAPDMSRKHRVITCHSPAGHMPDRLIESETSSV